jgi:ABC-type phosphate transport system substrate-binding protein
MKNTRMVLRAAAAALVAAGLALVAPRAVLGGSRPEAITGREGYRVVVNPGNPATALDRSEAARLFLKKITTWPDGTPVAVVDQARTAPVRAAFSRDVHKKDVEAVVAYWTTLVYSAREMPPPVKRSDAEVLEFVRQTPGALGYVSAEASLEGVKVVSLR